MAKRNKKKLKKAYRSQISGNLKMDSGKVDIAEPENKQTSPSTKNTSNLKIDNEEIREVRSELKKITINLLVIIVLITVIYLINIKTDFILKIGSWLSSYLNINV